MIDGFWIPADTVITSHAYTVQRDPDTYSDPEEFKPERWMVSEKKNFELDAAQFTFGMGSRVCIGKDIALMELYKLLPEVRVALKYISRKDVLIHPDCAPFRY
jgi:cytochrome P450